ncbi:type II secretion system F family protein [Thermicanus aegyptius]|uniref:type II secretion system F family protein n=1 Tax=Thermicanus aegyptius TaxID=94009 RepID=UPI000404C5E2|nr:type II secretion system F family protein [Thermicanus aegyptius]
METIIVILTVTSVLFLYLSLMPENRLEKILVPIKKESLLNQAKRLGKVFYEKLLHKVKYIAKQEEEMQINLDKLRIDTVSAKEIVGLQYLAVFLLLAVGVILKTPFVYLVVALVLLVPSSQIKGKWKKKRVRMGRDVLNLAELTAVGVSAGLSPLDSLEKAVVGQKGELYEELHRAIVEIRMGTPAEQALLKVSNVMELQEMYAFIDQLIQAMKTGSRGFSESVKEIVRHLRELRQARIEKQSEEAKAKFTLPIMMFFGAVLAFAWGPLVIGFLNGF